MNELFNSIMNTNYFFIVFVNYLIGFALWKYIQNEKKEYPDWQIPKKIFGVIASFFVFGLIPVINKLLIIFTILVICYFTGTFILTLAIFEIKVLIERFLRK